MQCFQQLFIKKGDLYLHINQSIKVYSACVIIIIGVIMIIGVIIIIGVIMCYYYHWCYYGHYVLLLPLVLL